MSHQVQPLMQPWIDTGVPAASSMIDGYAGSGPACRLMSSTTQPSIACAASGAHRTSAASEYIMRFMTVSFHVVAMDCELRRLNAPALDDERGRNAFPIQKTHFIHQLQTS